MQTRIKLFHAYISLLAEHEPQTITIQQLTAYANVHRVTFYKHFQHIEHFYDTLMDYYVHELYTFMKPLNYKRYEQGFEREPLIALFSHIQEHAHIYNVLFLQTTQKPFYTYMQAFFQQKIQQHTEELASFDFPGTTVHPEIVAWYGMSALIGTIQMLIHSGFVYTPEKLAHAYVALSPSFT